MILFESDEIILGYKILGQGQPLVLLHGFLENSSMWDELIPELENDFQLLMIDLPGHGASPEPSKSYTLENVAKAIGDLLTIRGISKPSVIGHSMGGYVALEIKKLIDIKVILLHSNFWEDSAQKKEDRNRVIELIQTKKNHFVSEAIPNLFFSENLGHCEGAIANLIQGAKDMSVASIAEATSAMRDRLSNYDSAQRASIIHGAQDPIISTEMLGGELKENQIDAELYSIENCGHMSIWESKEELINILNHILIQ